MSNIESRLVKEIRTDLSEVIPLSSPYVLLIDPSSACNLKCLFCPTGDNKLIYETGRFQGQMSLEVFSNIIESINECKMRIKVLRLYKEGEPLLNKNFSTFIKIAKESHYIERVDTTTNGILLTPKLSEQIITSKIDQINISINGLTTEQYRKFTTRNVDFKTLFDNIKYLCSIKEKTIIYVKCIKEHLSDEDQKRFFDLFTPIADKVFLEGLQPNWPNFSFDYINPTYEYGHYGQPLVDRQVCPFIFYMMAVNSDGSVSACVQDWQHEIIVGDTRKQSITEIWNSKEFNRLRLDHLSFLKENNHICAKCPVLKHGSLDYLDDKATFIKNKFLAHLND